jgi:glycosyltransferase involved in cell wall biosynthesis
MFRTNKKNDLSTLLFNKKMKFYTRYNNLYFVSPSKWLYDCAMSSFLTKDKPIFYIPNVIDNRLFKPFDKKVARQILNLDTDQTIISFGAISINSPYKGWSYLLKAIELLSKVRSFEKITVLVFGSGYNQQIEASIPCKTKFLGFLGDEYSIVLAYNASNVFVIPSLADNLPTMVLESLCCGTPVVGFNIGGIPDMIKHKENGYLAKYKNAEDLALGIKFCLENKIQVEILPTFQKDLIVNKHKELLLSLTRLENN